MAIQKNITIDGIDVPFKASAAVPRLYRLKFRRDIYQDFAALQKSVGENKESIYQNLGDYASHLSMTLLLDILYSEYFRQNYQKNYTYKLERARELEQHRTSTNPILLNLHKENAE